MPPINRVMNDGEIDGCDEGKDAGGEGRFFQRSECVAESDHGNVEKEKDQF